MTNEMGQTEGMTQDDMREMDVLVAKILDAYSDGKVSRDEALGHLNHLMAAIDHGSVGEYRAWFKMPFPHVDE